VPASNARRTFGEGSGEATGHSTRCPHRMVSAAFGVARESGAVPRWTSPCRQQEVLSWAYGCDSAVGLQAGRGHGLRLAARTCASPSSSSSPLHLAFAPPSHILDAYPVLGLTMNAPLHPEVLRLREESQQEALPLLTKGVQRYVWEGRFGSMLIEVIDGVAHVNGERVECVNSSSADGQAATSSRGA